MQQSIKRKFNRNLFAVALLALVAAVAAGCAALGTNALDKSVAINKNAKGLALDGYDAVAYFTENKPLMGKPEFTADYDDAKWQFATAENRAAFSKEPAKYAPQYGGYCAWAVSQGHTADTDPQTGKVVDGKLYLNYNPDVAKKWNENAPKYVADGDNNWKNWWATRKKFARTKSNAAERRFFAFIFATGLKKAQAIKSRAFRFCVEPQKAFFHQSSQKNPRMIRRRWNKPTVLKLFNKRPARNYFLCRSEFLVNKGAMKL